MQNIYNNSLFFNFLKIVENYPPLTRESFEFFQFFFYLLLCETERISEDMISLYTFQLDNPYPILWSLSSPFSNRYKTRCSRNTLNTLSLIAERTLLNRRFIIGRVAITWPMHHGVPRLLGCTRYDNVAVI